MVQAVVCGKPKLSSRASTEARCAASQLPAGDSVLFSAVGFRVVAIRGSESTICRAVAATCNQAVPGYQAT